MDVASRRQLLFLCLLEVGVSDSYYRLHGYRLFLRHSDWKIADHKTQTVLPLSQPVRQPWITVHLQVFQLFQ